jgi:hypothetical protein
MTWQEVNDMKPGTRVVVLSHRDEEYEGMELVRTADKGVWRFKCADGSDELWNAVATSDSSFIPTRRGWIRNETEYALVLEGRNKL